MKLKLDREEVVALYTLLGELSDEDVLRLGLTIDISKLLYSVYLKIEDKIY